MSAPVETVEVACPPCLGYGRCPTGEVDWYDGTDRGTHCDHCDGRGTVQVEVEPAEVVEAPAIARAA